MVVIRYLVGQVRDLRFKGRTLLVEEAFANRTQFLRVLHRAMLQYAFARLETQVQSVECSIALLQHVDDAQ